MGSTYLRRRPFLSSVLGLQFFACRRCETVYADPEEPPRCDNCGNGTFEEITPGVQAEAYFASSAVD